MIVFISYATFGSNFMIKLSEVEAEFKSVAYKKKSVCIKQSKIWDTLPTSKIGALWYF